LRLESAYPPGDIFVIDRSLFSRASGLAVAICLATSAAPALSAPPAASPATSPAKANAWGVPLTDVIPDPSIHYGTLPNGMKYAIMRNSTPKGTASVRLQFAFGSLAETDNEQGLAHFIEHMAFNGTTHVAEGDMVKMLQREGLAFGPDTNAQTGFDSTTYMLDLPETDDEHINTAIFLLREVGSEVKFDPAAVDRERGVILGEKRARDNFQLHQAVDLLGFDLPSTPYANRIPIGQESVIKTASADTIKNLYQRYYRPENATLVFVGDADPAAVEAKIRKLFADWKDTGPAGAALPWGTVDVSRKAAFHTFVDPAVATAVDLTVTRPWVKPVDTVAYRKQKVLEALAAGIVNRRIARLSNSSGSPLLGGGMVVEDQKNAARITTIKLAAKDGAWKDAVNTAEQEMRRALQHGVTASELKTELAATETALRTAAEQENTRDNKALANAILGVVDEDKFVTTPTYRYDMFEKVAKTINPAEVSATLKSLWTGSDPLVHLSTKQDVATTALASAFDASRAVAVAAPSDATATAFAYDDFGTPGKVAEDKTIADLGLRTVRFANNVQLNVKKTDFEAGKVRFIVRMGDGILDLPKDQSGLNIMLSSVSGLAALKKHSLEDLKELGAGKVLVFGTGVTDDAFVAAGATTPKDLALQMKVSAAYLLDPGFRPEAESKWHDAVPIMEKQIDSQPQAVAMLRLPVVLASGDARFGMPSGADLQKRSFAEARSALAPVIASAPIEITVVGDVDPQAVIDAVAASFGAIPQRKLTETPAPAATKAAFRTDQAPIKLMHDGPADQAVVEAAWPTDDDHDFRKEVAMDLLKDTLDLKLTDKVREALGDSYGVTLQSVMSKSFPGFGYLAASAIVAPDKMDEVQKAIAEAATELRDKPVDADLLTRARNPELEKMDHQLRDNGFWLGALSTAQSEPERLDRIRQRKTILQSITAADLQKLARQYLQPGKRQTAEVVSSQVASAAIAPAAAASR
jgi:zinc protease